MGPSNMSNLYFQFSKGKRINQVSLHNEFGVQLVMKLIFRRLKSFLLISEFWFTQHFKQFLLRAFGQSNIFHFNFEIGNYEIDIQSNYHGMCLVKGNYSLGLSLQVVIN